MSRRSWLEGRRGVRVWVAAAVFGWSAAITGCGGAPAGGNGGSGTGGSGTGGGSSIDGDSNVVGAKSFNGVLSGSVSGESSTRESLDAAGEASQQAVPELENTNDILVEFYDLDGEPLLDPNGDPIESTGVETDGTFTADGLPVGVDFTVQIDLEGDGASELSQIVQIPADETGENGEISDVVVDPLTTLVVAKLRQMFEEAGIDTTQLDISPTAIVRRVVDAFIHLFEESGIDERITVEDLQALSPELLDALFEKLLPAAVRTGIETVRGNLRLSGAAEIESVVKGAAEVFLRGGFPIVDPPGGIDLSFLGDLPDVEVKSILDVRPPDERVIETAQFEGLNLDGTPIEDLLGDGTIEDLLGDGSIQDILGDGTIPGDLGGPPPDGTLPETVFPPPGGPAPVVYVSTVSEPDLNFIAMDDDAPAGGTHLPFLNEGLLVRMAQLHLEHRTITLRNLHRILTDPEVGFGARLAYHPPGFHEMGPPPMVFESADGAGVERDVQRVIGDLLQAGAADPNASFEDMEARTTLIRQKMRELLSGTSAPTIERMLGSILSDRIETADQLFGFIRKARSHLPFNRSGSSTFFVLADGDQFNPDTPTVNAVTVDVQFDDDTRPVAVTYNGSGTGAYYLEFTHETDRTGRVQLLVRETGRRLHGPRGEPVWVSIQDGTLFQPVNGEAFADFVSTSGTFWPGVAISVADSSFRFDAPEGEGGEEGGRGPSMQLFVLSTEPGRDGTPVRVDYDVATGAYSYNPTSGRFYMAFVPETQVDGTFGLYDVDRGFMLSVNDLTADRFIQAPPQNMPGPFQPPDGQLPPPDGQLPPPDGTLPPPDGTLPPPDGTLPPPDGTTPPPDGTQPPPDDTQPPAEPPAPQEIPGDPAPPPDGTAPPPDGTEPPPPDGTQPPPPDGSAPPPPDGGLMPGEPGPPPVFEMALVNPSQVVGLTIQPEFFTQIFGTEVPNARFAADANPYYDDLNANGVEDAGEPTLDFRPILFNAEDWRSTDIARYYRRASGGSVIMDEVKFDSETPQTSDGETLVPRNLLPRLNALRFGRPNTAINLLTTFLPPEFFDGTHALNADTPVGIFQAIAMINLAMDQVLNVEAQVDIDGDGPLEARMMLLDSELFVPPIGDPFVLLLEGFSRLSKQQAPETPQ